MNKEAEPIEEDYIHEEEYSVSAHDTDIRNHCKLTNILNYLQETAARHVSKYGLDAMSLMQDNIGWVLSRLKIQMLHYPEWQEKVIIRTWSRGAIGILAYRDFEILNGEREIVGRGTSAWMLIDIVKRRPIRPKAYTDNFPQNPERVSLCEDLKKIPTRSDLEKIFSLPVMYSDVDINHHVNNVKYARWQIDAIPVSALLDHSIKDFEIDFLHEAKLGDKVTIECKKEDSTYYTNTHIGDVVNSRAIIKF